MSVLGDIATSVRDLLAGLQSGGAAVLATVKVHQVSERKAAVAEIGRLRKPAAVVLYDGRARGDLEAGAGAAATISLLLAVENLRGADSALLGGAGQSGAFDVLGHVSTGLDGAVVQTQFRLATLDERQIAADERMVVFEQRYRVDRVAELLAPTFGAAAIAGSESVVSVLLGPIAVEAVAFGFPGIDGAYRHLTGVKGRTITWKGQLRAADDAALAVIEADLERRVALGVVATMVDSWGRSFTECALESFERQGPRRRHAITGKVVQEFELVFTQLRT